MKDKKNALFVPPKDPKALSDAIKSLILNPLFCKQIAEANREKVKDFAPEFVAENYLKF